MSRTALTRTNLLVETGAIRRHRRSQRRLRAGSSEEAMISLPAGPLLFDTGIYIRFGRERNYSWLGEDARMFQRTILTAVVAAHLYAGTNNRREKRALDELCHAHRALNHFSSPPAAAWIDTGILRRGRSVFGQMDLLHDFHELLIAFLKPRGAGATLVTESVADFVDWRSLLAAGKTLKLFNRS